MEKSHHSKDLFHPSHNPTFQHDFDAVGVVGRLRQNSLDNTFGQLACPLILLLNDADYHSRLDIGSVLAVHFDNWITS